MSILVPISGTPIFPDPETKQQDTEAFWTLCRALAGRYVRRENRFFHVNRPSEPLSRGDVERAFINQVQSITPNSPIVPETLKRVFSRCIDLKHADKTTTIPVWGGELSCVPGNSDRIVWLETGTVLINTWLEPTYRRLGDGEPASWVFEAFFTQLFPRDVERNRVLDWLAWSLQNESKKPAWAVMLYSREKGTGKSTFCDIARSLFGAENTTTQNNVDKLTNRFNSVALTSRLVISEEVYLNPESPSSNTLKTYITDTHILAERKGREPDRLQLVSSFIFTTNHLPVWIEAGERRYYVVDTGHEGHSAGAKGAEFAQLVAQVKEAIEDPVAIARLYYALVTRQISPDFDAKTLNVKEVATEVMRRLQTADRPVTLDQLEEKLNTEGRIVATQMELQAYVSHEFKVSINATRHLMTDLGWTPYRLKWGGTDYARLVWAKPGYTVVDGNILHPDGKVEALCDYLALKDNF